MSKIRNESSNTICLSKFEMRIIFYIFEESSWHQLNWNKLQHMLQSQDDFIFCQISSFLVMVMQEPTFAQAGRCFKKIISLGTCKQISLLKTGHATHCPCKAQRWKSIAFHPLVRINSLRIKAKHLPRPTFGLQSVTVRCYSKLIGSTTVQTYIFYVLIQGLKSGNTVRTSKHLTQWLKILQSMPLCFRFVIYSSYHSSVPERFECMSENSSCQGYSCYTDKRGNHKN